MSGLAFVDTETTGLDPDRNPIWEVALIIDDVEHVMQALLPPLELAVNGVAPDGSGPFMTRWVLDNTGFDERYDRDAALPPDILIKQVAELVAGRHLVGAVPSFDEERLRRMYREHIDPVTTFFPWHYHLIDVEALAIGYLAGAPCRSVGEAIDRQVATTELPWKSDDLSRLLGVEPPEPGVRHTALGDARWAKAIYETVMAR